MPKALAESPTPSPDHPSPSPFQLGAWRVEADSGRITMGEEQATLEPRLMALLALLATEPGKIWSRDALERALWPSVVVGEDTVARAVSRLRRALGDEVKSPQYIETLPKRGYRLIAAVTPISTPAPQMHTPLRTWLTRALIAAVALGLLAAGAFLLHRPDPSPSPSVDDPLAEQVARADDLYMRFTRADNEAAIGLYERVLAQRPDDASAQAGLANALIQRVVRWPRNADLTGASTLAEALARGLTQGPQAQAVLARATAMAERAVRLAPRDPDALKALAFTYTARGDLDRAAALYAQVLELDGDAWAALINLGEIALMRDAPADAVAHLERAWAAMARAYAYEPQRVGPWQTALGVVIGETHEQLGQATEAELWYRRVLAKAPFEPEATVRLARLLRASGDTEAARALCLDLTTRLGNHPGCSSDSPN